MNFIGKICPVCSKKIENDDDIVVCPKCGAPYHRECYFAKGKCIFPELHKSKQSWKEVYDKSEDTTVKNDKTKNTVICPLCGTENPKSYPLCKKCGNILSDGKSKRFPFDTDDADKETDSFYEEDSFNEKLKNLAEENPFIFLIDPMGGVPKDEDFDGVNGAELAKFVRANTTYYMPTFMKIKNIGRSRFNIPAFFLTGAWYLYRKQYIKGALISLIYFALVIARYIITVFYSMPVIKEIQATLTASGLSNPDSQDIISWALENSSQSDLWLILIPSIIGTVIFILRLICGFTANRSYYKHCIQKVKQIKKQHNGEGLLKALSTNGGVNTPLAWSIMICYIIAIFAFSLF